MKFNDNLIEFFEDSCENDFWDYISDKVLVLPSGTDTVFFGCFPIIKNDILIDIRVSVPEIKEYKDMLINVHEFTHAIELYNELGSFYFDNVDLREARAKNMEIKYTNTFNRK